MFALSKSQTSPKLLRVGLVLFPGFDALDAFGPMDCLNALSSKRLITLSVLSHTLDPVSTKSPFSRQAISQSVVPTHTFTNAPALDVLIVPGGPGTHCLGSEPIEAAINFITAVYPRLKYLIAVRKGCGLVAQTGVMDIKPTIKKERNGALDDKPVIKEEKSIERVGNLEKMVNGWKGEIDWAADWAVGARWMVNGNVWTTSRGNSSVGIDVVLAWVDQVYGEWVAGDIAAQMEYERRGDARVDWFDTFYALPENDDKSNW